ncbi:hypothetical protein AAMO2058_001016500 [Amorphochlora amoebiformis]
MAPEGTFVDMPLALGVFLSVLGARLIASRINIIVQSLRRYIMLEKGIVERAERVRGEIGRGKRKLKELSIVDNFVLYSKTQRRIAKLEKELSQLDAKISVTKVSFPLSAVLRGIPMVLVAIVVRYLYFSKPIAAFIPLQRAPISNPNPTLRTPLFLPNSLPSLSPSLPRFSLSVSLSPSLSISPSLSLLSLSLSLFLSL